MANIQMDGGYMPLPINIKRGNPIPLDSTSVHYPTFKDGKLDKTAYANASEYAQKEPVAYVGQIITVCEGTLENGTFVPNMAHVDSGIYYIADKAGLLVKLVNNAVYADDKKEDLEVVYGDIKITRDDNNKFVSAIIKAPQSKINPNSKGFKKGTSDLFINGIKYNNSEYEELVKEGETDICYGILFKAFEIIPQNENGVGDEITIMADYE